MEAEIHGNQRKVMTSRAAPLRTAFGSSGIPTRDGRTLPFRLLREWSAPLGNYIERWYLVNPETREVLYEGPTRTTLIFGLQALTELVDEVSEPIPLEPGKYSIVYALDGINGGEFEVEAIEAPAEAA